MAGVSRQTISGLESGSSVPQFQVLQRILDILDHDPAKKKTNVQEEMWGIVVETLLHQIPEAQRGETMLKIVKDLSEAVSAQNESLRRNVTPIREAPVADFDPMTFDLDTLDQHDFAADASPDTTPDPDVHTP